MLLLLVLPLLFSEEVDAKWWKRGKDAGNEKGAGSPARGASPKSKDSAFPGNGPPDTLPTAAADPALDEYIKNRFVVRLNPRASGAAVSAAVTKGVNVKLINLNNKKSDDPNFDLVPYGVLTFKSPSEEHAKART